MKKILFVYGTRPEAIKMAPLIKEFQKIPDSIQIKICLTGQHRQMLDQINNFFNIKGDFDLNIMQANQNLSQLTINCINGVGEIFDKENPDLVFVQGDTTTAMASAIAAFYRKIPVAHLEAGLRSGDKYSPYPEEMNRKIISLIADYHFAPTTNAAMNLNKEGITKNVHIVGNTIIDALFMSLDIIKSQNNSEYNKYFSSIDFSKKLILITGHRRESFGEKFKHICSAIKKIANLRSDVEIVYPVHMNPNVIEPVYSTLKGLSNVHLLPPLDYPYLIWLMGKSYLVLTDSGGIQEEAPALGKPVLVMREVTERVEGIAAGTAKLVGTKEDSIIQGILELLENREIYNKMSKAVNPYGDGKTSKRIVEILVG